MKVSERLGVQYRFNSPIASIKLSPDNKTAIGVNFESGESLDADVVISNADLVYAYNNLLPPSSYGKSLESKPGSCSSISFYWALDSKVPELKVHNIFLADEYRESFDSIFKDQDMPSEPSFYVNVPSRVDPTAAPEGKDAVVVLCPCGHLMNDAEGRGLQGSVKDWEAMIAKARNAVVKTVEARTGCSLGAHIIHEEINTPQSWKERFNLDKGAILGLSHSFFNVLSFRPGTKHPSIKNMYFVGASTHPGTGVPIVLAGSKITSEQILKDFGMGWSWSKGTSMIKQQKRKNESPMDKVDQTPFISWFVYLLLAVVAYFFAPQLLQQLQHSRGVSMLRR